MTTSPTEAFLSTGRSGAAIRYAGMLLNGFAAGLNAYYATRGLHLESGMSVFNALAAVGHGAMAASWVCTQTAFNVLARHGRASAAQFASATRWLRQAASSQFFPLPAMITAAGATLYESSGTTTGAVVLGATVAGVMTMAQMVNNRQLDLQTQAYRPAAV